MNHFKVYNRWGQLVFAKKEPGRGWDGKFGGTLQPSGVFVWWIEAIDFRGNRLLKKGTVAIIR